MARRAKPDALIEAIHRSVRPIGVGERLDAARWIGSGRPSDELRAGLASLLARDADEWDRVARLVDLYFEGVLDEGGSVVLAPAEPAPAAPRQEPRPLPRWDLGSGWRLLVRIGGTRLLLAVGALLFAVALGVILWAAGPPPEGGTGALPPPADVRVETAEVQTEVSFGVRTELRELRIPWLHELPMDRLGVVAAFSLVFLALGWRWRHLEGPARAAARDEREKVERESLALRVRLEEDRAARGGGPTRLYKVELFPPLEPDALADSAGLLGGLRRWSGGREIDVHGTLRRTLEAGDHLSPVFHPRAVGVPVVVLTDVESGEHPWRQRVDRVVDAWRRQGVPLMCYNFQHDPDRVRDACTGQPCTLSELARRADGLPLIVVSRALSPVGRLGRRAWLEALAAFPRRAWVDPNPLALTDWSRRREVEALAAAGLPRFPLSEDGIRAAARHLRGLGPPERRPDPGLPPASEAAREAALERWAMAAALVPQPTWDQCEAIRRECSAISAVFSGPHCVAWLIDWTASQPESGGRGVSDRGDQLFMPSALTRRLLDELYRRARDERELADFARQINHLLERQLGSTEPRDALDAGLWRLRHALIEVRLHPERAGVLFLELLGPDNPWRAEAEVLVRDELRRHDVPDEGRAAVEAVVSPGDGVRWGDLLRGASGAWPAWRRWSRWVGGLALAVGSLHRAPVVARALEIGLPVQAELPAERVLRLRPVLARTEIRPEMVEIQPGRFTMGSPEGEEGRDDDEAQRVVTLTRGFLLARTEVTQGMYARVMGRNPSAEAYQGVSLVGEDLPVQNVSWLEAVSYCNRLSELEGLTRAYVVEGEEVRWVREADGYRLPTEAEWEYAARAGTSLVYAGTSKPEEVCRYGNVADASAGTKLGFTYLFPCDDGQPGLAPVGSYQPNAWGLYDLTGNVWEWTWDWYEHQPQETVDPDGPEAGSSRVNRGGSWWDVPRDARVADRVRVDPSGRAPILGFRPARSLPSAL